MSPERGPFMTQTKPPQQPAATTCASSTCQLGTPQARVWVVELSESAHFSSPLTDAADVICGDTGVAYRPLRLTESANTRTIPFSLDTAVMPAGLARRCKEGLRIRRNDWESHYVITELIARMALIKNN